MNWNELEQEVLHFKDYFTSFFDDIRRDTSTSLFKRDVELNLLKKPNFDVVVCGGVKNGKSSFINAIIGADILPTNTEVSTSKVFRISNEKEESYTLVFTDGSKQSIKREELPLYGSYNADDENEELLFEGKALDYISIAYPSPFLPKDVTIVDTPGINSIYSSYEQITKSYLVKAAAVIFIMDPSFPLTKSEMTFIKKAFSVTQHIMFVVTKIDNYEAEYITMLVKRNEEILAPLKQKTYNRQIHIFPMSSKMLFDAAAKDIDER
jgi:predicted GTPase